MCVMPGGAIEIGPRKRNPHDTKQLFLTIYVAH